MMFPCAHFILTMWAQNLISVVIHQETKTYLTLYFLNIPTQIHFNTAVVYYVQSNICYPLTTPSVLINMFY